MWGVGYSTTYQSIYLLLWKLVLAGYSNSDEPSFSKGRDSQTYSIYFR